MKKLIATFFVSTCAMVYANTQLGSHSLSSTSGVVDLIAVGRNAASESKNSSHSIFIGNNSGYAVNNLNNVIAIGDGAAAGARNLSGVVAIGDNELANVGGLRNTISINKQQLFISGVANAFSINPRQESSITNTPLHYIGGEITLQADMIKLKSKNSLLIAKQWIDYHPTVISTTEITNYLSDGSIHIYFITNMVSISNTTLPPSHSFNLTIHPVAHGYSLNRTFDYDKWVTKLIPLNGGAELQGESIHIGPLRFAQGYSVANENTRLTIKENYDAEVKMHFIRGRDLDLEYSCILPLSNALKDSPIEPILHAKPEPDSWNALISSSGVFEEFNRRLSGLSFDLEGDNRINVYYSGKKVGYITFTPEI